MSLRDFCADVFLRTARPDRRALTWWRNVVTTRVSRRSPVGPTSDFQVVVVCVYRARNASILRDFLAQCPADAEVRLWALDESLAFPDLTVGSGPGGKFELVNRLIASSPIAEKAWVIVADDDVLFSHGDLRRFLLRCESAGLDLAQPSHSVASHRSHPITLWRPWSRVRFTGFVECGPLFAVRPEARDSFIPFTEGGMGWGIEIEWNQLHTTGATLGIVDACRVLHMAKAASAYSRIAEEERFFATYGVRSVSHIKTREGTWYLWRGQPPMTRLPGG